MSKKRAVIFPGIGYHTDKPLLYYGRKLIEQYGYEIQCITFRDMPQKIRGNLAMMQQAAALGYEQTKAQLQQVDWKAWDEVLFVGKSIGTIMAAKYAAEHGIAARQIWYTPLEATYLFPGEDAIAFLGDADPWSDVNQVVQLSKENHIPMHLYEGCNHSLECEDVERNLAILQDVMRETKEYLAR